MSYPFSHGVTQNPQYRDTRGFLVLFNMTTYNNKCIYCCSSSYSLSEKRGGGSAAVVVAAAAAPAPAIAPPLRACLRPLGCTDSHSLCSSPLIPASLRLFVFLLVCARSVICSFSLHVASVRTRLCLLGWVSVCADPRYPVALVWPSFVLVRALLGFGWSLCVLSGLMFMSISKTQLVHTC